jgi:hypothetical protein
MIQRRTVLRGLGLCVALPLLEREANAAEVAAPMRMVCVANPLGFIPDVLFPKESGRDYETTPLLSPLPREKFTVFSHLDHGVSDRDGQTGQPNRFSIIDRGNCVVRIVSPIALKTSVHDRVC